MGKHEEGLKFSGLKQNIVQEQTNAIADVSQKEKETKWKEKKEKKNKTNRKTPSAVNK